MSPARLATFTAGGKTRYGAVTGKGVVDLSARYSQWPTLREVIEVGALRRLAEEAEAFAVDFPLDAIAYDIPIPSPEKIICVGVNYPDRNEEYKDGQAAPANPSLFIRFPRSFVGHGAALVRPPESPQLDYEGEVVIVISNSGKNASPIEVAAYARKKGCVVVGLTSVAMSSTAKTVHPDGKNLHAISDHVLDNGGVPGDTVMQLTPQIMTGPTSTFIGGSLLNWLMLSTMEWLTANGHPLPVLRSQNLPGAIEHNREVGQKYKTRLSRQLA